MVRPWDISSDDIDSWADQGSAPMLLPRLVRRLLLASSEFQSLHMAADGGVRLPGWDGVACSTTGHAFCPVGWSGWELSVEKKVRGKLNDDFRKRIQDPGALSLTETTYVAVTARRFPGDKAKWEAAQRIRGHWRDVRLVDAETLATWLEQCPSVALWFAALLGRPTDGFRDLETFLSHWRNQTTPPFDPEITSAGRATQVQQIQDWLTQPKPERSICTIFSEDTKEEALVFAAVALHKLPELERDRQLARSLVVDHETTFRWATQQDRPLLLFPNFKEFSPEIAFSKGHLFVPFAGTSPSTRKPDIELAWLPHHPLKQFLLGAGLPPNEAEQKVAQAEGKLSALRRLCGHSTPPPWADSVEDESLYALLMAGAWQPGHPGDTEAIRLLGTDPERLELTCIRLEEQPSPPVRRELTNRRQTVLQLTSPSTVWAELAGGLTEARLRRFADALQKVLGELDPAYELPKEQRSGAAFMGKLPKYSQSMRDGLSRSLVMLSLHEEKLVAGLCARDWIQGLLGKILPPSWKHWASLSPFLPTLAEADPNRFLLLVEESLNAGSEGVGHLMQHEVIGGYSPHTGLLFALEGLAWNPEWMPRVAYSLIRLAAVDPGGTLSNRPLRSVRAILRGELPQTMASVQDRLAVLRQICRKSPATGWSLALSLLPRMGMLPTSHRPEWLSWPLPARDELQTSADDYWHILEGVISLLIEYATTDGTRWAELIDGIYHSPNELAAKVLDAMEHRRDKIRDDDARISSTLRKQLSLLRGASPAVATSLVKRIEQTEQLYERFLPDSWILRVAWLFRSGEHLPQRFDDFTKEEQYRQKLQEAALNELWQQPNPWEALEDLVSRGGERSYHLPGLLAQSSGADQLESRLRRGPSFGFSSRVASQFLAWRLVQRSRSSQFELLEEFLTQGRHEEAAMVAQQLNPEPMLWDFLDKAGEPLRSAYWRGASACTGDDPQQRGRAIRNLLEAGAIQQALHTAAWKAVPAPADALLEVLECLRAAEIAAQAKTRPPPLPDRHSDYQICQVFELLENAEGLDPNKILRLEVFFSPVLRHSGHRPKLLWKLLSEQPKFFVQVIELYWRPEGGPKQGPAKDPEEVARAQAAEKILEGWEEYPGSGLSPEEREETLYQWVRSVLEYAHESKRSHGATIEVASVLARAPHGSDKLWPCMAARRLLEDRVEGLFRCLLSEGRNRRGVVTKHVGEGGDQERSLATAYRDGAQQLRIEYPETAKLLLSLAESYQGDAKSEDLRARSDRRRFGIEP